MTKAEIICRCNLCSGEITFEPERAGETVPCPHCAADTELYIPGGLTGLIHPQRPPPPVITETGEPILFRDRDILITNTRFVIQGTTLSVRNITSITPQEVPARTGGPFFAALVCFLIGVSFFAVDKKTPNIWAMITICAIGMAGSIWWYVQIPKTYRVVLNTASSERFSYETPIRADADRILQAVNNAIAIR